MVDRHTYFKRLLTPFWLRPESALWYAHEAFVVRNALGDTLRGPSLEVGCMDGVATFVMLGGEFSPQFDVYRDVAPALRGQHRYSEGFDYFDAADQDADTAEAETVHHPPAEGFSVGLAWKQAHVEKAAKLKIYGRLVQHDPNRPLDMFSSGEFELVWGPNLYWVDGLDGLLKELCRVLSTTGRIVTVVPDRSALDHMLYRFIDDVDRTWIENLDRGRRANVARQARTLAEWETLFASAGLRVNRHEPFLPSVVLQLNDIGFRPMFPVFMDIYRRLERNSLLEVKRHWVDVVYDFLGPLCDLAWMERLSLPKVWHMFELRSS